MTLEGGLLGILREVAGALQSVHSKGFVHLDVKSANVLIRNE